MGAATDPVVSGPAVAHRLLVVAGCETDATAQGTPELRHAERRQRARRLHDAALVAVKGPLAIVGVLLLAESLLSLVLALRGRPAHAALLGGLASLAIAVVLLAWARWHRPGGRGVGLHLLLGLAAGAAAWPAWLGVADSRPPLAALGLLFGTVAASLLAPLPRAWPLAVLVPPLACAGAAAGTGDRLWLLLGAIGSVVAWMLGRQRHRAWMQQTQTFVAQAERLAVLARERDEAQRATLDKSRFLAIASHDLRQPVHALGLFAATLQRRLQQSPDEPLARNLLRAVDGLERSFNAMLDISRLDGGAVAPRLQTFPLRDMFRRLHMHYAGQAELAGLGLRFSPGGKSVTSDPQLLERVVGNLIQNAIKYTDHGGIVVVARSTRSHLNLEVWDTGSGIAAAELPRIFDEFYQVGRGERDRTHGLGMGLAIVKRLVALLGHRLEVASTPGRGTMFRIGLPIGGLPGIQDELAPADTLPMAVQSPQMILVVDDEEPIREGLRLLLQEWGYQAMTAANGAQAELAISALDGHVDLVLSDLHLGDGPDGQEVVENLRRLCGRELPAILITGETAVDEVQRIAASGDPVLLKPVQPRQLFDAIRAALR